MVQMDQLRKIAKDHGWDESGLVGDYWFENYWDMCIAVEKVYPHAQSVAAAKVRWFTKVGVVCKAALDKYIEQFKSEAEALQTRAREEWGRTGRPPRYANLVLDFALFNFSYEGKVYNLHSFQELHETNQIDGKVNLMGVDLSGLNLDSVTMRNGFFAYATLDDARLMQVTMESIDFSNASLKRARLMLNAPVSDFYMRNSDVSGALLNCVKFTDELAGEGLRFSKVSQWYLIKCLFLSLVRRQPFYEPELPGHTVFLYNFVSGLDGPVARPFRDYVLWYQHVFAELRGMNSKPPLERLKFGLALLFTKCWSSYSVLAVMSFLVVLFYSCVYYVMPDAFFSSNVAGVADFSSNLYFSVVTFTTLGYGDIYPVHLLSRIAVISEVLVGYVLLGCFVFLIGHKVSARF